jgi:hypothetical protein
MLPFQYKQRLTVFIIEQTELAAEKAKLLEQIERVCLVYSDIDCQMNLLFLYSFSMNNGKALVAGNSMIMTIEQNHYRMKSIKH